MPTASCWGSAWPSPAEPSPAGVHGSDTILPTTPPGGQRVADGTELAEPELGQATRAAVWAGTETLAGRVSVRLAGDLWDRLLTVLTEGARVSPPDPGCGPDLDSGLLDTALALIDRPSSAAPHGGVTPAHAARLTHALTLLMVHAGLSEPARRASRAQWRIEHAADDPVLPTVAALDLGATALVLDGTATPGSCRALLDADIVALFVATVHRHHESWGASTLWDRDVDAIRPGSFGLAGGHQKTAALRSREELANGRGR